MFRKLMFCLSLLLASAAAADDSAREAPAEKLAETKPTAAADAQTTAGTQAKAAKPGAEPEAKLLSGMSVLGNDEAPKALVIVPWKSSLIGDMPGISRLLDDSTQPVDRDVFMRELAYHEIRSK